MRTLEVNMEKEESWSDSIPYDLDEVLGRPPRGFRKRWQWYQEIARKEKEEEEKRANGK